MAKPLAEVVLEHMVLAKNLTQELLENSTIIPVPLEKSKLKNRGYNQSQELGKELGQSLNVPLVTDNLVKIKKTQSQVKLKAREREENLKDAFKIKNPSQLTGKKVFLVDDVYTTVTPHAFMYSKKKLA